MRRILSAAIVVLVAAPVASEAAERGKIAGRVVDGRTDAPVAGARVVLAAARPDGGPRFRRRTVTGRDGRYRFSGLPAGPEHVYALEAHHDGGVFAGGALSLPDDTAEPPVIDTVLRVWRTTTDPKVIVIRRDDLFAVPADGGLGVIEAVRVVNLTDRAYIGRTGSGATLGLALPPGAAAGGVTILDADIDVPGLVATDFGAGATVAIPPGETRITYTYSVPGTGGAFDLSRPALYDTTAFSIHAADPLEIRSNRLERDGTVRPPGGDRSYARWSAHKAISPGDSIQVVAVAHAGGGGILAAGAAVVAAGVIAAVAVAGVRRRRRKPRASPGRDDILLEIARLDADHDRGEVADGDWARRRADLKARLGRRREPAP